MRRRATAAIASSGAMLALFVFFTHITTAPSRAQMPAGKTAVGEPRPEGEYDKAIADLTEAIRREPHSAVAYTNRARAFLAAKLFDKAMADLEQAVRLDPLDAKARLVRGDVWRARQVHERNRRIQ